MTAIAKLEACIAIGEVKARYCRRLDTRDGRWRIAAQRLTRLHVDYYYEP